jgi:hypothetical protein
MRNPPIKIETMQVNRVMNRLGSVSHFRERI